MIDVQRGDDVITRLIDGDNRRPEVAATTHAPSRCRPPSSDSLWLRLQYRSFDVVPGDDVDDADDVETVVGGDGVDRPSGRRRRRERVRHGRRRRRRNRDSDRSRRWRLRSTAAAAAASNSTSDGGPPNSVVFNALRRRGYYRPRSDSSRRAWQCGLEKFWRRTGPDVFPAYVQTGRCSTPTCMMGLYECRERRYAVGVLRRHRGHCVPLPLTNSSSGDVEELWTPSHFIVVVACECSARRATGVFPRVVSSPL